MKLTTIKRRFFGKGFQVFKVKNKTFLQFEFKYKLQYNKFTIQVHNYTCEITIPK